MFNLKRKRDRLIPIVFICLFICQVGKGEENQCTEFDEHRSSWSVSDKKLKRILSDATSLDNQEVPQKTIFHRFKTAISNTYRNNGVSQSFMPIESLAKLITRVAKCTGNDFAKVGGLLFVESKYCAQRVNLKGSGAKGCGQFTSSAVDVFKNQLKLPGRKDNDAGPQAKKGIETLLMRCFRSKKRVEQFKKLFSGKASSVKKYFASGKDMEMDLVASAVYLKFLYGVIGYYYKPGKRGALGWYGEGRPYAKRVFKASRRHVNYCTQDTGYMKELESEACQLSNDPDDCYMTEETFEI